MNTVIDKIFKKTKNLYLNEKQYFSLSIQRIIKKLNNTITHRYHINYKKNL